MHNARSISPKCVCVLRIILAAARGRRQVFLAQGGSRDRDAPRALKYGEEDGKPCVRELNGATR